MKKLLWRLFPVMLVVLGAVLYYYKETPKVHQLSLVFTSIVLEALPFVILGTLISSFIGEFVRPEHIEKILPKNAFLGLILSGLLGLIFPLCECAIVPVTRRLLEKGMSLSMGITFMLATPIVNPIVLFSTGMAFSPESSYILFRGVLGFLAAVTVGGLVQLLIKTSPLKARKQVCHSHCSCSDCEHDVDHHGKRDIKKTVLHIIDHTTDEFRTVGTLLLFGAFISALVQVFIPHNFILSLGSGKITSILVMMILAFILSICSEADAFIAKTFVQTFSKGSIIGFLLLGPMLDIKNIFMLLGAFSSKFVLVLSILIATVCFSLILGLTVLGVF